MLLHSEYKHATIDLTWKRHAGGSSPHLSAHWILDISLDVLVIVRLEN